MLKPCEEFGGAELMNKLDLLHEKILSIIIRSGVPEDPLHARNTLEWLHELEPAPDAALQTAALGHDIERAMNERKVRREHFPDYDAFKAAHAKNSAIILRNIIRNLRMPVEFAEDVFHLVRLHETGGDPRSDLIRDADSLSFFHVNLPLFYEREGIEKTLMRCRWGYKRLSAKARRFVATFTYENDEICELLDDVTSARS